MSDINQKNFKTRVGDLFDTEDKIIGHGTNTQGKMASGIAVLFKKNFPQMHERYLVVCEREGSLLFGTTQLVRLAESDQMESITHVANIFSQDTPGKDASYAGLILALEDLFEKIEDYEYLYQKTDLRNVSIPRIGCGIGGLDWPTVEVMLEDYMRRIRPKFNLTVVIHPDDV